MISAAAMASHLPWRVPLQHRFCDDRLHRHTPCDHPAAWFGRIPVILHKIAPFLPYEFCYTVAIMTGRGAVGNLVSVSWFLLWSNLHQPIKILIWWEIYPGSLLGPSDGLCQFVQIIFALEIRLITTYSCEFLTFSHSELLNDQPSLLTVVSFPLVITNNENAFASQRCVGLIRLLPL